MQDLKDKTVRELAKGCQTVDDVTEMLKNLFKDTLTTSAGLDSYFGAHSAIEPHISCQIQQLF
ncbi:MAG: hypothetical protein ACYDG6_04215 [Thermincolia bacterium]